ncbi:MAG: hypothetical protein KDD19_27775, partial [Phaeodactylibacter sp.]|nr:hypothetical protein [Phaeodactylibacter sp.]
MSELALKLIHEARKKKLKSLNLGNCGLTELPKELFELVWLEELVVSNEYWDEEKEEWIKPNGGELNKLQEIHPEISLLKYLKKLDISGEYENKWEIKDISPLEKLTQL